MKSRIWLALFTLYIAWGTTYLAIRFAVETIPPFFMTGMRFLVAGLVLYFWRRATGDPAPTRFQWRSAALIGTFLLVGGIGGVTLAEQFVPSGIAALIIAATPLWVVLIDALRRGGERPSRRIVSGVVTGLAGIAILADHGIASVNHPGYNFLGIAILLAAGLSWAVGSIYSKKADLPASPLLGTGMELLAGSAGSFILGLLMGEAPQLSLSAITLRSLAGLGYLIVVGSLVGFVCYTWLIRVAPASQVMTYAYVNPVVAVFLGSLLAGEALTPNVMVALPLILVSVALTHWGHAKPASEPAAPLTMRASAGDD